MINKDDRDTIEEIMDRTRLRDVLQGIAQICVDKGEHVLTNWQDRQLSLTWDRAGTAIEKLSASDKIKAAP